MEFNILPKFVDEAATPVARSVGNTVSGIWDLAIGNQVNLWLKKQEVKHLKNLEEFTNLTQKEISSIPTENLKEPELHLLGPIFDASKYSLNSEELRKIFSKLVASCLDSTAEDIIHPSFIEIVKQLSPKDAQLLSSLPAENSAPIISIELVEESKKDQPFSLDYNISFKDVFQHILNTTEPEKHLSTTVTIDNLIRLGLVTVSYENSLVDDNQYSYIYNHPAFQDAQNQLVEAKKNNSPFTSVQVSRGLLTYTTLGKNFHKICLSNWD